MPNTLHSSLVSFQFYNLSECLCSSLIFIVYYRVKFTWVARCLKFEIKQRTLSSWIDRQPNRCLMWQFPYLCLNTKPWNLLVGCFTITSSLFENARCEISVMWRIPHSFCNPLTPIIYLIVVLLKSTKSCRKLSCIISSMWCWLHFGVDSGRWLVSTSRSRDGPSEIALRFICD